MPDFKALLFDLDGTLLDTAPDFVTSLNIQLGRHNRPPLPDQEIRAGVTNGSIGLIKWAFQIDEGHHEFNPLREEFLAIYYQHLADRTGLFDGLQNVLDGCMNRGIPWGIVTNKPWKYTEAVLTRLDMLSDAATIICPDHVSNTKPHPESVLLACAEIGVAAQDSIMVGDHQRDIDAGRAAGARTVAAGWGYISADEHPGQWRADWTLEQSTQLHTLLFENA